MHQPACEITSWRQTSLQQWFFAGATAYAVIVVALFAPVAATGQETTDPAPIPLLVNGGDGVLNGSFEFWIDGDPLYWTFENKVIEPNTTEPPDGRYALQMGPRYVFGAASQILHLAAPLGGHEITLSAVVAVDEPETARIAVALDATSPKSYSDWHTGDGKWQKLTVTLTVPPNHTGTSYYVYLIHGNTPQKPARFDDVTTSVK